MVMTAPHLAYCGSTKSISRAVARAQTQGLLVRCSLFGTCLDGQTSEVEAVKELEISCKNGVLVVISFRLMNEDDLINNLSSKDLDFSNWNGRRSPVNTGISTCYPPPKTSPKTSSKCWWVVTWHLTKPSQFGGCIGFMINLQIEIQHLGLIPFMNMYDGYINVIISH